MNKSEHILAKRVHEAEMMAYNMPSTTCLSKCKHWNDLPEACTCRELIRQRQEANRDDMQLNEIKAVEHSPERVMELLKSITRDYDAYRKRYERQHVLAPTRLAKKKKVNNI
jgi:hypothetical protein